MNLGKTLFAQLMEFVPWTSFARIVARYSGDARVSALPSTEHFRIMAYAQLTWRESLRDIEVTLGANATKLYGMGLRQAVRRSTLADANERRDWRIWADFAAILIRRANKLYADEPLGLDVNIKGNVYALDSSTIDLCLSLFNWAPFRSTKAAIKLHTLLDLRGSIPSFIHISDGKMGDVNVLDILPMEAGDHMTFERLKSFDASVVLDEVIEKLGLVSLSELLPKYLRAAQSANRLDSVISHQLLSTFRAAIGTTELATCAKSDVMAPAPCVKSLMPTI
jgi:hypothetical protein